jgi:hypothetical protein
MGDIVLFRKCPECQHKHKKSFEAPCDTCFPTPELQFGSHFDPLFSDDEVVEPKPAPTTAYDMTTLEFDVGLASTSPHYNSLPVQPIQLMEAVLTREEFLGYLKGNMIKYAMRAGKKDAVNKDVNKYVQYKTWYEELISNPHGSINELL